MPEWLVVALFVLLYVGGALAVVSIMALLVYLYIIH